MKLVFLDRDGVINTFPGNGSYVTKVKDFHFLPGVFDAIRELTQNGYTIFVISNQAGVGKGWFSQDKLNRITAKMIREVEKHGGKIREVFYSISRSDAGCCYRKPNTGLIKLAMKSINKTMKSARHGYFIGDTQSDIQTGKNAGCKTIFVLSGREDKDYLHRKWTVKPDYIAADLPDAVELVLALDRKNGSAKPVVSANGASRRKTRVRALSTKAAKR